MNVDNNGSWNTGYQTFAHSLCQLYETNDCVVGELYLIEDGSAQWLLLIDDIDSAHDLWKDDLFINTFVSCCFMFEVPWEFY